VLGTASMLLVLAASLVTAWLIFPLAIPRLLRAGIYGRDVHKPGQPEVAEMGGVVTAAGFCGGMLLAVGLDTFLPSFLGVDLVKLLAALSLVLATALIGIFDDLVIVRQSAKAALPLLASLPLVAVKAGHSVMTLPLLGRIELGILYPLVLVPLGVTGAANAFNMLAGFNGLEAGLGLVATGALVVVAWQTGSTTALVVLLAAMGALAATLRFNWYPAKVFIGDAGTYGIGAILACAVILGNFETAGVLVIAPHALDFLLKAKNRFPSTGWWGEYRDGKLCCPASGPVGLPQVVMKLTGGISERNLTLVLMGFEGVCGAGAIMLYI